MLLRTIFFFVIIYFLIKVISRLFLSSGKSGGGQQSRGPRSGAEFFYTVFNQARQQGQQENSGKGSGKQRIDQIEEAEFEEITDEEEESENADRS